MSLSGGIVCSLGECTCKWVNYMYSTQVLMTAISYQLRYQPAPRPRKHEAQNLCHDYPPGQCCQTQHSNSVQHLSFHYQQRRQLTTSTGPATNSTALSHWPHRSCPATRCSCRPHSKEWFTFLVHHCTQEMSHYARHCNKCPKGEE